jgi:hypothetical protein
VHEVDGPLANDRVRDVDASVVRIANLTLHGIAA